MEAFYKLLSPPCPDDFIYTSLHPGLRICSGGPPLLMGASLSIPILCLIESSELEPTLGPPQASHTFTKCPGFLLHCQETGIRLQGACNLLGET